MSKLNQLWIFMEKITICITRISITLLCAFSLLVEACVSSENVTKSRFELGKDRMNEINKDEKSHVLGKGALKLLQYDFCENNDYGYIFRYPCDIDSSHMNTILNKIAYVDSIKGLKINVQSLYFPFYTYDRSVSQNEGLSSGTINRYDPQKAGILINKDGSMTSECGSLSEEKCTYLFAEVSVSKIVSGRIYYSEVLNIYIDSLFVSSNYPEFILNELAESWWSEEWKKNEIMLNAHKDEIPYNLCWDGEMSIPCDLDSRIKDKIVSFSKKIGELKLITQTTGGNFYADASARVHLCKSSDRKTCDEIRFLVDDGTTFHAYQYTYKDGFITEIDTRNFVDNFRNTWTYFDESGQMVKLYDYGGQGRIRW